MGDATEVTELFLQYPNQLNPTQMADYDDLFHHEFKGIMPSVRHSRQWFGCSRLDCRCEELLWKTEGSFLLI